ncbi:MAG: EAL domain-containing protein, partial [Phycisphaerales bacterium]
LLVSNTGSARDTLAAALKANGVHCLCAPKDQALQMACSTQTTCVVLLDDASNFSAELLQHIRATHVLAHTLVVVIAAANTLAARTAAGADAVIADTAGVEEIRAVIESALVRREQWLGAQHHESGKSFAARHVQSALEQGQLGSVLLLRFDHFTNVSTALNSLGVASDALQVEVERSLHARLTPLLPTGSWMTYMDEENFLIALPRNSVELENLADTVAQAARMPLFLAQREIRLRTHAGLCVVMSGEKVDARTLIGRAEMAADHARGGANSTAAHWSAHMNSQVLNDLQLASALQHAVEHSEFQLLFQPQINMSRGDVYGAEALIRWTSPTGVAIAPGRFVAVAQECGVMDQITLWSLREACRHCAAWEQIGLHIRVAVNITANQLGNPRFVDTVRGALSESGVSGGQLAVEISEAAIISNPQVFNAPLTALRNLGVTVCMDDFGVGVATLANMKALPVSELKIDRSFIRTLPGTAQDRMMVQTMLALSKQLNVRMIAVGVENITQWAWLNEHHCDGAQGWLIGKAVGTEEFPELVGEIRQNKFAATSARVAL